MNKANVAVLSLTDLQNIKNHSKMTDFYQKHTTDHINAWAQRIRNEKKKKDQEMKSKFEKEELVRREVDLKEAQYQQDLSNQLLYKSNQQIFENDPKIRRFYSKMLYSDVQQENGKLINLNAALKDHKQLLDEALITQQIETEQKIFNEQERTLQEKQQKRTKNIEDIKEQKEFQKQFQINNILNDRVEGQMIKQKALEEVQEKEWQKKQRMRKYNNYKNDLQEHLSLIQKQKNELLEKERQEEEYRNQQEKKKEDVMKVRKMREQSRLDAITAQRDKAIQIQEQAMKNKSDNENMLLEKHLQQMEEKRTQELLQKEEEHKRMQKEMNDFALMSQIKKQQILREEDTEIKEANAQSIQSLATLVKQEKKESQDKIDLRKQKVYVKEAQEQQIKLKQQKRQQQYLNELYENEERQNNYKYKENEFDEWAMDQILEYEKRGYKIGPIKKEMNKIQDQRRA